MAFCRWLSNRLGYEIRLPTEAEWEKAQRDEDGRDYPWGYGYRAGFANVDEKAAGVGPVFLEQTTAVGLYPQAASPYGVEDLAGNIWEWCLNEFEDIDRTRPGGDAARALRGGSWYGAPEEAGASFRYGNKPVVRSLIIGFRLACASPISH
jgi:formylglycine-generating enzyme required for sulfatase activity